MVRSFLVNSSVSTRVTSYEFQLLSKLILDEQTRTSHLEEDMKDLIKGQQTMKNSKVALETQLNTTKTEQIATRQELIATQSELNDTKKELEGHMILLKNVTAKLDKEITNRHQLQMAYAALATDFHNLSVTVNPNMTGIGILSHRIGRFTLKVTEIVILVHT